MCAAGFLLHGLEFVEEFDPADGVLVAGFQTGACCAVEGGAGAVGAGSADLGFWLVVLNSSVWKGRGRDDGDVRSGSGV